MGDFSISTGLGDFISTGLGDFIISIGLGDFISGTLGDFISDSLGWSTAASSSVLTVSRSKMLLWLSRLDSVLRSL